PAGTIPLRIFVEIWVSSAPLAVGCKDPGAARGRVMAYWLMKSEPDEFGVDDLYRAPDRTAPWDGVRNYQARNMLRDEMREGDEVLFYHSSCTPPGVAGLARVVRAGYPDASAWDPTSPYYDPASTPEKPRWYRVDVQWLASFPRLVTLAELREEPALADM